MDYVSAAEARDAGFPTFNDAQTLCIDVPDGMRTISCRTSAGEQVTFCFIPYDNKGPADCIDIYHHTSTTPAVGKWINDGATAMNVRCFSGGGTAYPVGDDPKPVTLMCLILGPDKEEE